MITVSLEIPHEIICRFYECYEYSDDEDVNGVDHLRIWMEACVSYEYKKFAAFYLEKNECDNMFFIFRFPNKAEAVMFCLKHGGELIE